MSSCVVVVSYNSVRALQDPFTGHDEVIQWKHFPRYWPFVWGIHRSPVNSPHKGQWALMFSLICAWINGWVNNRGAGDFETPSHPLWRHSNGGGGMMLSSQNEHKTEYITDMVCCICTCTYCVTLGQFTTRLIKDKYIGNWYRDNLPQIFRPKLTDPRKFPPM